MRRMSDSVFWVANAGMEISWIYAWVTFIIHPIIKRPCPLPEAVAIFVLASVVTAFTRGRGWRIIQILLMHAIGLSLFAFRSVYVLWYQHQAFWAQAWISDFFSRPREVTEWLALAAFWSCVLFFWVCGIRFTLRSRFYPDVCSSFDKGLGWLFALLILRLLIRVQIGVQLVENISEAMIFPFFIFALLAVALARNRSGIKGDFMSGFSGTGLIISFSMTVLICGTGVVLLFLPYLRAASEVGYEILKTAGRSISPVLISILRFIFGYKANLRVTPGVAPKISPLETFPEIEPTWWTEFFLKVYLWVFWVILGAALLIFSSIGVWFLFRWLFSRTHKTDRNGFGWKCAFRWLERWMELLSLFFDRLFSRTGGHPSIRLYGSLLKWGRRSGLPYKPGETPLEYGLRLEGYFGGIKREIDLIVDVFNQHVYAQAFLDEAWLSQARQAFRKLKSPILWPKRFKLWFLRS